MAILNTNFVIDAIITAYELDEIPMDRITELIMRGIGKIDLTNDFIEAVIDNDIEEIDDDYLIHVNDCPVTLIEYDRADNFVYVEYYIGKTYTKKARSLKKNYTKINFRDIEDDDVKVDILRRIQTYLEEASRNNLVEDSN